MTTFEYKTFQPNERFFDAQGFNLCLLAISMSEAYSHHVEGEEFSVPDIIIRNINSNIENIGLWSLDAETEDWIKEKLIVEQVSITEIVKTVCKEDSNKINKGTAVLINSEVDGYEGISQFFIGILERLIESVEMISFDPFINKDSTMRHFSHTAEIKFKQDGNVWHYKVSDTGIDDGIELHINSVKNPVIIGKDAEYIDFMFRAISMSMASMAARDHLNNFIEKSDAIATHKAKIIAGIIGGSYKDYLLMVYDFDFYKECMDVGEKKPPRNELNYLVLRSSIAGPDVSIRKVARLFRNK